MCETLVALKIHWFLQCFVALVDGKSFPVIGYFSKTFTSGTRAWTHTHKNTFGKLSLQSCCYGAVGALLVELVLRSCCSSCWEAAVVKLFLWSCCWGAIVAELLVRSCCLEAAVGEQLLGSCCWGAAVGELLLEAVV